MKPKVLFVDDEQNILFSMKRNLRTQFEVYTAESAEEGWKTLRDKGPFKVVVSDYRMPGINGMQFLVKVREIFPEAIRIMLTGQADFQTAIDAVNKGELFRFLSKPFPARDMISVIHDAVKQFDLIEAEKELLQKTLNGTIKLMVDMLSISNPTAFSLAGQMRDLAPKLCKHLKVEDTWVIELGASLSQIGVLGLPSDLIEKVYGGEVLELTETEAFIEHYETGFSLLNRIPRLESVAEGIYYQGKHFDGTGYPTDDFKGKEIPLLGRLLKVLFDYQVRLNAGHSGDDALTEMQGDIGAYDPEILNALASEVINIEDGLVLRELTIFELQTGMIVAQDIKTSTGILLMKKRSEINDINILRLAGLAHEGKIAKKIQVLTVM